LVLEETAIPIRPAVRAVCEVLGLEPLGLACEGRVIAWVPEDQATRAMDALRSCPGGDQSAVIGRVEPREGDRLPLVMETEVGSTRPLDLLSGTDLPRIC